MSDIILCPRGYIFFVFIYILSAVFSDFSMFCRLVEEPHKGHYHSVYVQSVGTDGALSRVTFAIIIWPFNNFFAWPA